MIFRKQINIRLPYRLIQLILVHMVIHTHFTQNKFKKFFWYLKNCEIEWVWRWASKFSINWCYHFWWTWPDMLKVLKITSIKYLCDIWRRNWVMNVMFLYADKDKSLLQVDIIILMGLARHAQSTWQDSNVFVTS